MLHAPLSAFRYLQNSSGRQCSIPGPVIRSEHDDSDSGPSTYRQAYYIRPGPCGNCYTLVVRTDTAIFSVIRGLTKQLTNSYLFLHKQWDGSGRIVLLTVAIYAITLQNVFDFFHSSLFFLNTVKVCVIALVLSQPSYLVWHG